MNQGQQPMKTFKVILFFIIFVLPSFASGNENFEGWDKTKWGMTQEEVRNLYSDTIMPSNEKEQEKIIVPFIIENFIIEGISCKARFIFDKNTNKLQSVILHAPYSEIDEGLFQIFYNYLISKYGDPHSHLNKETGGFKRVNEIWAIDKTKIILIFIIDGDRKARGLAIKYADISIKED
jgi:hypothetical protein